MNHRRDGGTPLGETLAAAGVAAIIALLVPLVLIAAGHNAGRAAWDSTVYHEPFIRQLARDWPQFDLSNPLTATTPGYHILLSTLARIGADSTGALRVASALIGAGFIAAVAAWTARRTTARDGILLTLPLSASLYVLGASAWLLPDNLSWLGVFVVLALCVHEPRSWRSILAASGVLVCLVLTRQIHLWAAAPIWLAAWMGVHGTRPGLFDQPAQRLGRASLAFVLTLPAFLIVAWFVRHWGGTTPPRFRTDITGVNTATPAFILLQIPILFAGFFPWLAPALVRALRDHARLMGVAACVGLTLAVLPPTTLDRDAGRYSGWWSLAGVGPALFGRTSPAMLVLAPAGAAILAASLRAVPHRPRWVLLGSLVAFAAAQSSTINAWQRYHEPFLIVLLAMLAALQPAELRSTAFRKARLPAMLSLAAALGTVSAMGLRGEPVAPGTPPPPKHTSPGDPWAVDPPPAETGSQSPPVPEPARTGG
ncbi:MAG: hypothetical protein D6692_09550 [Planctomycetota bacterium]|nr:MAG: hypothetical protein D6692_09550 [Planctomycetota bacterium]